MRIVGCFDELHVYAYRVATLLHATFENVGDPELPRDLRQIFRRALEVLRRSARDHFQVRYFRQPRQDFILHAFGEIGVIWVAAQVIERQNGNRFIGDHGN